MILEVKKIHPAAKLPIYKSDNSARLDLFACGNYKIVSGECKLITTGIAIKLPQYTEAQIKSDVELLVEHSIGVSYDNYSLSTEDTGELFVVLRNFGVQDFIIGNGMKIAQLIIRPLITCLILEK